jgi:adenylate kinase family enzyme
MDQHDDLSSECGRRIAIVGTTGSGKTTLAQAISERLRIPHVELDELYWGPDWVPVSLQAFRERTEMALDGDAWVSDGNYGKVRDIVWRRADTVVWLDYSLPVILGRLTWRTLRRILTREDLWSGNRERFHVQFFTRNSLFLWAFRTFHRRRWEYPVLFQRPEYAHLRVICLRSSQATRKWLEKLR